MISATSFGSTQCTPNATLRRHTETLEASATVRFEAAPRDGKVCRFKEFFDAAPSWSRVERVIARVEAGEEGPETRFIVTNLARRSARCRRGHAISSMCRRW